MQTVSATSTPTAVIRSGDLILELSNDILEINRLIVGNIYKSDIGSDKNEKWSYNTSTKYERGKKKWKQRY